MDPKLIAQAAKYIQNLEDELAASKEVVLKFAGRIATSPEYMGGDFVNYDDVVKHSARVAVLNRVLEYSAHKVAGVDDPITRMGHIKTLTEMRLRELSTERSNASTSATANVAQEFYRLAWGNLAQGRI